MRSRRTARPIPTALAAAVLLLTGCGDGGDGTGEDASSSQGAEQDHNDADVRFATQMIPHHAQALMMTDMTAGRELSKETAALVDAIRAAQAPEIELMTDWLQEWGEPVPATVRDHVHGGHDGGTSGGTDGMDGMDEMDGMMSEEDLAELEQARPAEFEDMWLSMMVEHHEGAVAMAEDELADGAYQPALDLAEEIARSQTEEIEQMEAMLAD